MDPLNELLEKARKLNGEKKYKDVIDLITETLLITYNSAELYAEKAKAHQGLLQGEAFFDMADMAHSLDAALGAELFNDAIIHFTKEISENPDSKDADHNIGTAYQRLDEYDKSIEYFERAIKVDPSALSFYGLGLAYHRLARFEEALPLYEKAIEANPNYTGAYNNLGTIYKNLKDYKKAIEYYEKAIEMDASYDAAYYNRATVYSTMEEYKKSLADYEKYVALTKDSPDYYTTLAQSKIIELGNLIDNPDIININELVNKIKELLLVNDTTVTHYTSLTGARALILDDSPFRISEGAYLNDTSEGRELFNYLPFHVKSKSDHETIAEPFAIKPFIGSFVAENKHNDLTLWRMYGKEAKEEAKGCAITFKKSEFLENLKKKLTSDNKSTSSANNNEEFSFYRVAYCRNDEKKQFVIPGSSKGDEAVLNEYMLKLSFSIKQFNKGNKNSDLNVKQYVLKILNGIAYLFKSEAYQHEHEIRLVVNGTGIKKMIRMDCMPPKVFIELINIDSILKKITIGPKVERADEWAAAFFYKLEKDGHHPEIVISHLPFK